MISSTCSPTTSKSVALASKVALIVVLLVAPARASTDVGRCRTGQLHVKFVRTEGAAGTIYNYFNVRNDSSASCYLRGYFGVRLLNGKGEALETHVHKAGRAPDAATHQSRRVVLDSGEVAHFDISYTDACRSRDAVKAKRLRLKPPRAMKAVVIPAHPKGQDTTFNACDGKLNVYLTFKRKS